MKRKNKRLILLVATLAFALTACTSPVERQAEQQAALTLRIIDLMSEGKL